MVIWYISSRFGMLYQGKSGNLATYRKILLGPTLFCPDEKRPHVYGTAEILFRPPRKNTFFPKVVIRSKKGAGHIVGSNPR
jgi:hypothetical protein